MNATATFRACWNCRQAATHTLTREGSLSLDACDNCTRLDRAEAESRGWTITRLSALPAEVERDDEEDASDEDGRHYPFTVLIGRSATYFNDRPSADTYAAQYSSAVVATNCVLGDAPDVPCPNPIIGSRYATAGPLAACAYHLGH
ncbi:hypothetical protein [Streptomyces sp. NPDC020983]|uniref:hypothetical protein n=1 Tax=Streptomyces sp. NPDC020983 TaxID=3365106 RepID=UPI0037A3E1A2